MDKEQARIITTNIQQAIVNIGAMLNRIRDELGYVALGYTSFSDYLDAEITKPSRRHLYRLMASATLAEQVAELEYDFKPAHLLALGKFPEPYRYVIAELALRYSNTTQTPLTAGTIKSAGLTLVEAANTGCVDLGDGESTPLLAALTTEQVETQKRQLEYIQEKSRQRLIFSKRPAKAFGRTLQFPDALELTESETVLVTIYKVDL